MITLEMDAASKKRWRRLQNDMTRQVWERGIDKSFFYLGRLLVKRTQAAIKNPPKTGRIYRLPGGRRHQASAPGQPPANRSGALMKGVNYVNQGQRLEFGYSSDTPYGLFLEKGTRKMSPRFNLEPRALESAKDAESLARQELEKAIQRWMG